jgi:uncharacterized protein YndB with AHSA1/START domain
MATQATGDGSGTVSVSREIKAPAETVWALVSDLPRMGEWSPENDGGDWLKGATKAVPGAKFKGANTNGDKSWTTTATILEADPGRSLSFRVAVGVIKVALWSYTFEPTEGGCIVTETWTDQRNGLVKKLATRSSGVENRAAHNREGMEYTLARLAKAAEAAATT